MRNDATIDGKQVICRNASTIGYSSVTLRVGMCFVYRERYRGVAQPFSRFARMLGRIAYAPALSADEKPIHNFILAMVLSEDCSHAFERWIDPADVLYTGAVPTDFAAFFFAPTLPYDLQTMRRLLEHGTCCDHFIANAPARVAEWKARSEQQNSERA